MASIFHLAVPVQDLSQTRRFYGDLLGCREGRSTEHWIDWDFFGHQLSTHRVSTPDTPPKENTVDGCSVPSRHFGVILSWADWYQLKETIENQTLFPALPFIIPPYIRFEGEVGEQATMFFSDPSGNALEFKAFKNISELFSPDPSQVEGMPVKQAITEKVVLC